MLAFKIILFTLLVPGTVTALVHAMVLRASVRFYEEPALRRRFGAAYERYRARVPRRVPGRRASKTMP